MRFEDPPAGSRFLVIGYGNTLRSDDGVGVLVAKAVAACNLPGVTSLAVHQLTPELADWLADAELAIFVDARLAEEGREIAISPLEPSSSQRPTGHISDTCALLALAQSLYGRSPRAWLITVPAVDLSLGEKLSTTAARGVEAARILVLRMLEAQRW
jgi:hydrogenase maturation protease